MNKRKPDDEFALINLSYFKADGSEHIVYCPESKSAQATLNPRQQEETIEVPETEETPDTSAEHKEVSEAPPRKKH